MASHKITALIEEQKILNRIYVVRGQKVMLDKDLAEMYGVETRVLKQSVKRNNVEGMVSQKVIPSKSEFGGVSPFCFTEQGVTMLSCILNSTTVVQANTRII